MSKYYYLDVSLEFAKPYHEIIDAVYFKENIIDAVDQLFGEVAAVVNIDILKYNSETRRAILRLFKEIAETTTTEKMSHCRRLGPNKKDVVIFATKEDHQVPSTVKLPEPDPQPGLILPNGDINWNCPCLGGMATGPCGVEFRNAFSCFHYSEAEPKGSNCYDLFKSMQSCMQKYPTLYNKDLADDDELSSTMMDKASTEEKSELSTSKSESETSNK